MPWALLMWAAAAQAQAPDVPKPKVIPAPADGKAPLPAPAKAPDSGPIINDADFNAALPPLDATAAPPPPAPPAETPGTATETLPTVTVSQDADLNTPLPALNGYDVQPQALAEVPSANAPQIDYDTVVDGLKDVNGAMTQFKALSALEAGKGKAANTGMVRARATEDEALILRLLKAQGYYDGTVATTITTPAKGSGHVQAHITVNAGKPYRLWQIAIQAQATQPADLIRNALPLKQGDIIVADQVLAAEANVSLVLPQNGYPFAKVNTRDITLDPQNLTGDYTLPVDTGPRSRFGGFRTDGKQAFDARHIAVLTRFKKDDLYDSRKVDDLRQALIATSLFSSVAVEPVKTDQTSSDGASYVDLLVHQQAGPPRTLAAEAGYSTGEGLTASGSWTHRNLFPPEGALILTGTLGTQRQGLGAQFRRSNDGRRDLTTAYGLLTDHTVYDTYEAYTAALSYSKARVSTPIWQKRWTWSYGADVDVSRESNGLPVKGTLVSWQTYTYADLPLKLGYDTSNDLLNPTKGFRATGQLVPAVAISGVGASNLLGQFDASVYQALSPKMVLAGRVRIGSLIGADLTAIAPSRRLYAGGGGSVRGFAYQALGPIDVNGNPTGGRSVSELSLELRYRFGDYGIVPFIDAGQVYDASFPSFSNLKVGAGIGARLYTNFGPIRIDVATPLTKVKNDQAVALYVGIGQAY